MIRPVPRPLPVEVLTSVLLGRDADVQPLPAANSGFPAALERVMVPALERAPCVVSFSGGRDSSAVLAAATDVARRHGLQLPIPVTMRFPGAQATDESAWQELVLSHLGLREHEVLDLHDELDALGAIATAQLRSAGLLWPANAYMHRPVIDVARGGSLLTGAGGDELFSTSAPRRSPRQLAPAALPVRLREDILVRRRALDGYGWLTPQARRIVHRVLIGDEVRWPYRWDHALAHWYRSRAYAALAGAIGVIAASADVRVVNPLLEREVLAELARIGGRRGFPTRTDAMRRLFGHLLPEKVLARPHKAVFNAPIWGPATRAFVAALGDEDVDPTLVDLVRLRGEVSQADPDARSVLLVQQIWLHASSSSASTS